MINGYLEQFLDTGWFMESTLYLNGYTYWCEGYVEPGEDKPFHFFVLKYRAVMIDEIHTKRMVVDGDVVDYQEIFSIVAKDEAEARALFLSAPIFEGKTFWEVEDVIAWYDEG